jgi:hypothetical protein
MICVDRGSATAAVNTLLETGTYILKANPLHKSEFAFQILTHTLYRRYDIPEMFRFVVLTSSTYCA